MHLAIKFSPVGMQRHGDRAHSWASTMLSRLPFLSPLPACRHGMYLSAAGKVAKSGCTVCQQIAARKQDSKGHLGDVSAHRSMAKQQHSSISKTDTLQCRKSLRYQQEYCMLVRTQCCDT